MKNLYFIFLFLILNGCQKSEDGKVEIIPLPPTELKATVISKDQVDLTWKDNSTNETGFKIERKTDSGNFTEIGSIALDVTTFSDKTVDLNTNYTYRVYSFNQVGKSISYSNEVVIKTLNVPALTTYAIDQISSSGANSGGTVTSDGGSTITSQGIVWDTATNPTIALSTKASSTTSPGGLGAFKSSMTGLKASTKYFVRAFATNSAGTSYGNELTFSTSATIVAPTLTTSSVSQIYSTGAISGGVISSDGNSSINSRGVVWSTSTNPTIQLSTKTINGTGIGSFQSSITGLLPNTKYYVRAYATNMGQTGYGNEVSFTSESAFAFKTVTGANGKIWIDRNLGATQVATSSTDVESYGDLYQWGRGSDGHQKRTSPTTSTLATTDFPGHGNFIINPNQPNPWRSGQQNNNLWQGVNGVNNPCPDGFRLPTETEFKAEIASWNMKNADGAFSSPLKLPRSGGRVDTNGQLFVVGTWGRYWTSTIDGTGVALLYFYNGPINNMPEGWASIDYNNRAFGACVRCIKN
jgi:hypothetical protein